MAPNSEIQVESTSAVEEGTSASDKNDAKLLAEAHARLKLAAEAESDIRALALEDLEFRSGQQWPDKIKEDRNRDGRPCLVINRIPQFIQQVTNDQRQNRPAIKAHPVDDFGDVGTAKIIQGLIRHIEYDSNADVAFDTGFDSAVTGGLGYWRVITKYVSPMSFEQEIKIKRIRNPFSVFFDPFSQEPDGSDANWAFVVEELSQEEYKAQYPHSKLSADGAWEAIGNQEPDWVNSKGARICEYFYKELSEQEIALLSDGRVVLAKDLPQDLPPGAVVRTRKTMVPVIKWCKLNGAEILEKTDWLGIYIPIVPVYGTELYIEGKRILEGIVRNAKDAQRMYNYWKSAETEAIALAPRAPFIVAEGQLEGYEAEWAAANKKNHAYLTYKAIALNGQPVGPPQRNSFEPAIGAISQASMGAAEDLKATTGIYDASLGGRSNETSGVAIQRRNQQAQTSNFHFIDNLTRSLKHTGRILIDLIPKVYDTARAARIIGDDGEQKVVKLNQETGEIGKDGKPILYRLDVGKYDATVDVGPSYASKRQEAAASMLEMSKANPAIMQIAGDLMVKSMDWPGAPEIAERLKKTLPPGIADDPNAKQQQVPPQVQQQMQQMGQMLEQVTKQLHEAQDALDTKRVEIESRERIEMAKLETTATIELAKLESKESLNVLAHQIAELDRRTKMLGMDQSFDFSGEPEEAQAPQEPGQEQFSPSQTPDGGMPADQQFEMEQPTGGNSPGSPMEGNFQ